MGRGVSGHFVFDISSAASAKQGGAVFCSRYDAIGSATLRGFSMQPYADIYEYRGAGSCGPVYLNGFFQDLSNKGKPALADACGGPSNSPDYYSPDNFAGGPQEGESTEPRSGSGQRPLISDRSAEPRENKFRKRDRGLSHCGGSPVRCGQIA